MTALCSYQPSQAMSPDIAEQRSFHYVQLCMAQQATRGNGTESWHALMLQAARAVPSVQHSIFALGFLLQARAEDGKEKSTTAAYGFKRSSLLQYTKAVKILSSALASSQASEQSTLITCLLFIWIEMLQGNLDAALQHLKSGLGIIVTAGSNVPMCLYDMYTRLHAQARLHGSPSSKFNTQVAPRCTAGLEDRLQQINDLTEARQSLGAIQEAFYLQVREIKIATGNSKVSKPPEADEQICRRSVLLIRHVYRPLSSTSPPATRMYGPEGPETTAAYVHIDELRLKVLRWQARFAALTNAKSGSQHAMAAAMLQLQALHLSMMIEGVLSQSEMEYDRHRDTFGCMLALAESILRPVPATSFAMLPLEAGVIPPLFMVALKCRDMKLRRQAISLLELAPEQECMWRRDDVVTFAKWKLEQEGESLTAIEQGARIHSERTSTCVINGEPVTVLRYKRGGHDFEVWTLLGTRVLDIAATMGDVL